MKFHEFGKQNAITIMLIHGLATTWEKSFIKVIQVLAEYYYVIAAGLDGHDPEEKTNYLNGEQEAEQIEEFIQKNLGGTIDVIYGSSLGCVPALLIADRGNVKVRNIILDGTADLSLRLFTKPASKFAGWFGEQVFQRYGRGLIILTFTTVSVY